MQTPMPRVITPFELRTVSQAIAGLDRRSTYLEIGSLHGGSLAYFNNDIPAGSLMVCVDLTISDGLRRVASTITDKTVKLVGGDSKSPRTVDQVKAALAGRPVDVLFIDGDHTHFGAASDARLYAPLVGKGGLIVFHDCGTAENIDTTLHDPDTVRRAIKHQAAVRPVFQALSFGKRVTVAQEYAGVGIIHW